MISACYTCYSCLHASAIFEHSPPFGPQWAPAMQFPAKLPRHVPASDSVGHVSQAQESLGPARQGIGSGTPRSSKLPRVKIPREVQTALYAADLDSPGSSLPPRGYPAKQTCRRSHRKQYTGPPYDAHMPHSYYCSWRQLHTTGRHQHTSFQSTVSSHPRFLRLLLYNCDSLQMLPAHKVASCVLAYDGNNVFPCPAWTLNKSTRNFKDLTSFLFRAQAPRGTVCHAARS